MCGIVGCTGNGDAVSFLIDGLQQLEYRGYDSVGIAVEEKGKISTYKKQGRVATLSKTVEGVKSTCGIGHTRWATHGKPSDINSHPHSSGKFAVVHNGIIENYLDLKQELIHQGFRFLSETDTEVVAHLMNKNYKGDFLKALKDTTQMLTGSYALAIICEDYPGVIAVTKKNNPLILGKGQGENYLASDSPALAKYTNEICVLQDNDVALLYGDRIEFYNYKFEKVQKEFVKADIKASALELGSYESYMMKEISEIPEALRKTVDNLLGAGITPEAREKLKNANAITVVACGTAYHSGIVAKYFIEKHCRIPVNVEVASEYRYRNPIVRKGEVVIAVSQSGETADTIAAVRLAKDQGAYIVTITNVATSSITGFADCVIHTKAGPEIAVAATKSYNCQLTAFYFIAMCILGRENEMKSIIGDIADKAQIIVDNASDFIEYSGRLSRTTDAYFLGRDVDYAVALEGSLKLKEISYIHSEGCPAGELKHGPLALIEKGTLVITILTQRELADKTMNAVHEVKARGANVLLITQFEDYLTAHGVDMAFKVPEGKEEFMPILSIIPLQIFSYYISRARGNDPDKPRNLAKSVTVE